MAAYTKDEDVILKWVEDAKNGDQDACRSLYRNFVGLAKKIAQRILGERFREWQEDAVQEIFLHVFVTLKTREIETREKAFQAFFASVAKNKCVDFKRYLSVLTLHGKELDLNPTEEEEEDRPVVEFGNVDPAYEWINSVKDLSSVLEGCSPSSIGMLLLSKIERVSEREIAKREGCDRTFVRSDIERTFNYAVRSASKRRESPSTFVPFPPIPKRFVPFPPIKSKPPKDFAEPVPKSLKETQAREKHETREAAYQKVLAEREPKQHETREARRAAKTARYLAAVAKRESKQHQKYEVCEAANRTDKEIGAAYKSGQTLSGLSVQFKTTEAKIIGVLRRTKLFPTYVDLAVLYLQGRSVDELATKYELHPETVRCGIKKQGIEMRPQGRQRAL